MMNTDRLITDWEILSAIPHSPLPQLHIPIIIIWTYNMQWLDIGGGEVPIINQPNSKLGHNIRGGAGEIEREFISL